MDGVDDDKKINAEDISLFWVGEDTPQAKKGWHSPTLGWEIKKPCDCTIEIDDGKSVQRYEHVESSGEVDLNISKKANRVSIKVTCNNGSKLTKTITWRQNWYIRLVRNSRILSPFNVLFLALFAIAVLDGIFSLVCDIIGFSITPPAICDNVLIPIHGFLCAILLLAWSVHMLMISIFSALKYINQSLPKVVLLYVAIMIVWAIYDVIDYLLPHYAMSANFILSMVVLYLLVEYGKNWIDWDFSDHCIEEIIEDDGTISKVDSDILFDYMQINRIFRQASNGNEISQLRLASIYHDGIGLRQDYEKSVKWFSAAAAKGSAVGKYFLAGCYLLGEGVEEDDKKAVELLIAAAEEGYSDAQLALGWCYMEGKGTPINTPLAKKWLSLAASKGNSKAKEILEYLESVTIS